MSKVVTANSLSTGAVVFLAPDGSWRPDIAEAEVFADAGSADEALAGAKNDEALARIVEPFVVDQGAGTNGKPGMTLRDSIRAFGPTITYLPAAPVARG